MLVTMSEETGWERMEDLVALSTAGTADELHRRLVLMPMVDRNPSDSFEPLCLFRQYHQDNPAGAVTTALLLVTDRRWRRAVGRIIAGVDASGLVRDDDLDLLAEAFLRAGESLYWRVPDEWFAAGFEIVLGDLGGNVDLDDEAAPVGADDEDWDPASTVTTREIRPPLRRWAAARLVRRQSQRWGAVQGQARELDPRSGAAVMRGLLDCRDVLPESTNDLLRRTAAEWPQADVRRAA